MQYNINSFTLHQQVDKQTGLTSLVATNKAGNFTITFGPELMATSAFPELLNEGVENATEYIELILNLAYVISNMPMQPEAYNEILAVLNKYNQVPDKLPDELSADELEQDLALAHAAEQANTPEKIAKIESEIKKEIQHNAAKTSNKD